MTYAEAIFETPESWGSETVYADTECMLETIKSLIDAGGDGWEGISITDCRQWQLTRVGDNRAVYKLCGIRADAYGVFVEDGGFYELVDFLDDLTSIGEEYADLA